MYFFHKGEISIKKPVDFYANTFHNSFSFVEAQVNCITLSYSQQQQQAQAQTRISSFQRVSIPIEHQPKYDLILNDQIIHLFRDLLNFSPSLSSSSSTLKHISKDIADCIEKETVLNAIEAQWRNKIPEIDQEIYQLYLLCKLTSGLFLLIFFILK
jgi:hypothetical protein